MTSSFIGWVREFPFLARIMAKMRLFGDQLGSIRVKYCDRNLIEVTPGSWAHDVGADGEHSGFRHFWCISKGDITMLQSSWSRSQVPHGTRALQDAEPIGVQLLKLDRDVEFIVEVHDDRWDWEEANPEVVIYKMKDFDWRRFSRFLEAKQS